MYKWQDFIWVDASLRGDRRSHVLIHELGHALGLSHNLCWDSVMTYEFSGPQVPYFVIRFNAAAYLISSRT